MFCTKEVIGLGKVQFLIFLLFFFKIILNFLEKYSAKPEILGSILKIGYEKLVYLLDYGQFDIIAFQLF